MRDDLLLYYERELTCLRQMGAQFAEKYPKVASRLLLEPGQVRGPARRAAAGSVRVPRRARPPQDRRRVPGDHARRLLGIVYPHLLRPIPSMSIVEFQVDAERGGLTSGLKIEKESLLYSRPVAGAVQIPHLL